MQKPFFSIIVVSLNAGKELKNTVDSILSQTCRDYEIVIKDGGSGDQSLDFLQFNEKDRRDHNRIKLVIKKDGGIYEAMNQAVKEASGEYYLFLNCGDYFYDSYVLEKTKEEIEKKNPIKGGKTAHIFYGNLFNRKQNTMITSSPGITDFTLYRNVPCHQVCFYHHSLFAKRGYDVRFRVRADYEHFLYCVKEEGASCFAMSHLIASYEGGGFSETRENKKHAKKEHKEITNRYLGKAACRKYQCILFLTLAPLRSKIAENPRLSVGYNKLKSLLYQ